MRDSSEHERQDEESVKIGTSMLVVLSGFLGVIVVLCLVVVAEIFTMMVKLGELLFSHTTDALCVLAALWCVFTVCIMIMLRMDHER